MFSSIVTFEFDSILWSFLTFCRPNGLFLKSAMGCTHVVGWLLFSMFSLIVTFDFTRFFGSTQTVEQFSFSMIPSTLLNLP